MNFRLTNLKTIISIIIGLVVGYLLSSVRSATHVINPPIVIFTLGERIMYGIIAGIIIYIIWSLFQKKR